MAAGEAAGAAGEAGEEVAEAGTKGGGGGSLGSGRGWGCDQPLSEQLRDAHSAQQRQVFRGSYLEEYGFGAQETCRR